MASSTQDVKELKSAKYQETMIHDRSYPDAYVFHGMRRDADTGVDCHDARRYDLGTGSWISRDPGGFAMGDENLMRFVGNAPTNATDSSGLEQDPNRVALELKQKELIAKNRLIREIWASGRARRVLGPFEGIVAGDVLVRKADERMKKIEQGDLAELHKLEVEIMRELNWLWDRFPDLRLQTLPQGSPQHSGRPNTQNPPGSNNYPFGPSLGTQNFGGEPYPLSGGYHPPIPPRPNQPK